MLLKASKTVDSQLNKKLRIANKEVKNSNFPSQSGITYFGSLGMPMIDMRFRQNLIKHYIARKSAPVISNDIQSIRKSIIKFKQDYKHNLTPEYQDNCINHILLQKQIKHGDDNVNKTIRCRQMKCSHQTPCRVLSFLASSTFQSFWNPFYLLNCLKNTAHVIEFYQQHPNLGVLHLKLQDVNSQYWDHDFLKYSTFRGIWKRQFSSILQLGCVTQQMKIPDVLMVQVLMRLQLIRLCNRSQVIQLFRKIQQQCHEDYASVHTVLSSFITTFTYQKIQSMFRFSSLIKMVKVLKKPFLRVRIPVKGKVMWNNVYTMQLKNASILSILNQLSPNSIKSKINENLRQIACQKELFQRDQENREKQLLNLYQSDKKNYVQ